MRTGGPELQTPPHSATLAAKLPKKTGMSKILVIGAAGLLGARVVEALGEDRCIRASRNSGTFPTQNRLPRYSNGSASWTGLSAPAGLRVTNLGLG